MEPVDRTDSVIPGRAQQTGRDAQERVPPTLDEHVDALYRGPHETLRPLHEAIVEMTHALGDDIEAQPRASYVALVRRAQAPAEFLALAPGSDGTLRVGLRFRGEVPDDHRLAPATGFAQATHSLHVSPDWLDAELLTLEPLIATAYDQNG